MGAKEMFYGLKGTFGFLGVIRDPRDTGKIIAMNRDLRQSATPEEIERTVADVYSNPALEASFQNQYSPAMPTFEELQTMPEGSFGRELAAFITRHGLDHDIFPPPNFADRANYLESRIYQAHDAWHVLTGYTPTVIDELALQAFGVAQYRGPLSLLLLSAGMIHILKNEPQQTVPVMESITRGFTRGKQARNLLTEPVLERLREPLEVVRRDLNIFN